MLTRRTLPAALGLFAVCASCTAERDDNFVRGHRLTLATLSADSRARAYEAALRGSFELRDPALTLLLDRRVLPREGGFGGTQRMNGAVEKALRDHHTVQGACEPDVTARRTPQCTARGPGYVVRFSDVFRRGGDTLEVYLGVQKFDTPSSGASEALRFERAYRLVPRGNEWQPTAEARVRETRTPTGASGTPVP
jgi:hypothetical protein